MRLRNIKNAKQILLNNYSNFVIIQKDQKFDLNEWFTIKKPLLLEIGCGKGGFAINLANQNPNFNVIAVEKYASVLIKAKTKLLMQQKEKNLNNLKYVCSNAEFLLSAINPYKVNQIFLNFSDPWPKKRHVKRRLTYKNFLNKYKKILKKDGKLIIKTDNLNFFNFSIKELINCNWKIIHQTNDLYSSKWIKKNIATEYELKFHNKEIKINYLVAKMN